ncbi:fungal specific transcription factor [Pochonia chlamydosporia 170]|uniref:Fungal specific transcription factor n=1 Tax=Pochonia chlamydosporia 170 TaxID=1380566 RepID=A0A219AS36_METCM|nr:fungal specific transcription factor [Pochonia chlamydosporia 170]OWT43581.1 fungal specific transcription factor [Pochonia chlamydosporia 170]
MPARQATQACRACRRLKRKCSRDLPSCSLCIRLGKTCEYYPGDVGAENAPNTDLASRLHNLEQLLQGKASQNLDLESMRSNSKNTCEPTVNTDFPPAFFLDPDHYSRFQEYQLSSEILPWVEKAQELVKNDWREICERFLSTIYTWLPMISKKRLYSELTSSQPGSKPGNALFLLCMKLCTSNQSESADDSSCADNELYNAAKQCCFYAESGGYVSLRLVQSLVLLAVYEMGHAIYPAAYLTVGRAARLATVIGLHNMKLAKQLFVVADMWSLREEQQRTWWAIFILDKVVNLGSPGLPLVTPDPCADHLLPVNERDWNEGVIGINEPVLAQSFHAADSIGKFARTCQAAHMLGKIITHVNRWKTAVMDVTEVLLESFQLHKALAALDASLNPPESLQESYPSPDSSVPENLNYVALSICCSARYLLYSQYACNESNRSAGSERIALETEAQQLSIQGMEHIASVAVPRIARYMEQVVASPAVRPSVSFVPGHSMYYAGLECYCFYREFDNQLMLSGMRQIIEGFKALRTEWRVGAEYLVLLDKEHVFELLERVDRDALESR